MKVKATLRFYGSGYWQGLRTLCIGVGCIGAGLLGLVFLTLTIPLVAPRMLRGKEEKPCTD